MTVTRLLRGGVYIYYRKKKNIDRKCYVEFEMKKAKETLIKKIRN